MKWLEKDLPGARVLDLFSGTGAVGLEALSRGAKSVDFVENGASALHALRANIKALRVTGKVRLFRKDAIQFVEAMPGLDLPPYDLAFADPPWTSRAADRLVAFWQEYPFSRVLAVETAPDHPLPDGGTRRILGEAAVTVYRARPPGPDPD
jgi:16S rRNA (guanine966-N2)-methyltransferase